MADDDKKFTQVDVDRMISERLAADRGSRGDPTAMLGVIADLKNQLATEQAAKAALQNNVTATSRTQMLTKIGLELKVPQNLFEFIQGTTEDEMKVSAAKLVTGLGPGQNVGGATNPPGGNAAPTIYTVDQLKGMTPEQVNADWENISAQLKTGQVK